MDWWPMGYTPPLKDMLRSLCDRGSREGPRMGRGREGLKGARETEREGVKEELKRKEGKSVGCRKSKEEEEE